jgi:hypothetical protein
MVVSKPINTGMGNGFLLSTLLRRNMLFNGERAIDGHCQGDYVEAHLSTAIIGGFCLYAENFRRRANDI